MHNSLNEKITSLQESLFSRKYSRLQLSKTCKLIANSQVTINVNERFPSKGNGNKFVQSLVGKK